MILVRKQCRLISVFLMLTRLSGLPVVGRGMGRQPRLVRFDVLAVQVGAVGHLGVGVGQPGTELTQVVFDVLDRARSQAHCDLLDVAARRLGESRCDRCPSGHRYRARGRRARAVW